MAVHVLNYGRKSDFATPLRLFTNAKILGLLLWERPLPYSRLICQGLWLLVLYVQSTCPSELI